MSITIAEILKLPSMNGAELLAGRGGLNRAVEAVSVLEYGDVTEELEQFSRITPLRATNWSLPPLPASGAMWMPNALTSGAIIAWERWVSSSTMWVFSCRRSAPG